MRRNAGVTLIELMVVMLMTVVLMGALGISYSAGMTYMKQTESARVTEEHRVGVEDRLASLLRGTVLPTVGDNSTYFIGSSGAPQATPTTSGLPGATTSQGGAAASALSTGNADTITFLTMGQRMNGALLLSDDDFETLNQRYGPQGGIAEISIGTQAVGDPGTKSGLFIREQRPYDGDPSQGGKESVFDADVKTISFEFFDGDNWVTSWETRTMGTPRLPAAVRVTYTLNDDADGTQHIFLVQIPNSDVTVDNPITQGTGTGATQ